ncbi:uracil-DNA glycosylase [Desulfolucanica intricata]|uniref:uracil-DNA glycosylase n=1 Tax=Desulfolucanica intricata TaxID=1285191 RepID=UPI000835DAC1|nr:uracil-DNA glycosylase [Desulfolucanica intricata]
MEERIKRWNDLKEKCLRCTGCGLAEKRTNVVFGEGYLGAKIMFIGEGPGQQEDEQGRPFVGRAGVLLDKMLGSIDLSRETNAMICNVVKCRPPGNRVPSQQEARCCLPYLRAQVAIVRPQIIVCLGATAVKHCLDPEAKITKIRGRWFEKKGFWLLATFHPAALLRDPSKKALAWEDFKAIREKYQSLG